MLTNTHTTQVEPDTLPTIVLPDRFMTPTAYNAKADVFTGFVENISLPGVVLTRQLLPQFTVAFLAACGHDGCNWRASACLN